MLSFSRCLSFLYPWQVIRDSGLHTYIMTENEVYKVTTTQLRGPLATLRCQALIVWLLVGSLHAGLYLDNRSQGGS